jgi:hypothetical protein
MRGGGKALISCYEFLNTPKSRRTSRNQLLQYHQFFAGDDMDIYTASQSGQDSSQNRRSGKVRRLDVDFSFSGKQTA